MSQPDFIQVTDNAVSRADCAAIVQRMRDSQQLHPGRIGGGVFPGLKHSRDLRISGIAEWADVEARLQQAVFDGVLTYLRHYPQALISPLMLQVTTADGTPHRLVARTSRR